VVRFMRRMRNAVTTVITLPKISVAQRGAPGADVMIYGDFRA
jgi:hypothetical protein